MDKMLIDQAFEAWLAVGRQAHYLVLAGVHAKSDVLGKCTIKQAEGGRETDFVGQLKLVSPSPAKRRCRPFAHAVDRQTSSCFEWSRKKCTCSVRLVMIREDVASSISVSECEVHFPLQMQLGFKPQRQRHHPRAEAVWRECDISLDQTV